MHKYSPYIILVLLVLCIMGSAIWSPGGILLLDYLATPHWDVSLFQNGWFLFPQIPVMIFWFEFGTKGFFLLTLLAAALLGILWAKYLTRRFSLSYEWILMVIGGAFFLMNPFAYERMMVQPTIYLGIILLGYVLYFLMTGEGWKKWIFSGICAGVALNLFLHASYMLVLIFGLYILFFVRTKRDILGLLLAGTIILLFNANWLLSPLFDVSGSIASIGTFWANNLTAFATQALEPMSVWVTNILLYGFWGEQFSNHYANVDFLSSLWYVAGFLLILLMGVGKWTIWQRWPTLEYLSRKYVWFLGIIALASLIFGIGIASPLTRWLTEWMIEYVPLWQGYREPQKWIGLLMIVEGIFLIAWVWFLLKNYGEDSVVRWSIVTSIAVLFLIWSPGPLMGYHGQLRTTFYPTEYADLRTGLMDEEFQGTILALPWHSYIGCNWTGRPTISNPIQWLLAPLDVIVADNIEAGAGLYTNSSSPQSVEIEAFLKLHDFKALANTPITHILLMQQCANSDTYSWLDTLTECKKVTKNTVLSLYQCQK